MTRMLALSGAVLPKQIMSPHPDNPAGFWESQAVTDLNDEILQALDSDWDDVFAFRPRQYLSNFDHFYLGKAVELLAQEFDGRELIVLKDPRVSVLATFWDRALREGGYHPYYVVMVRSPLEVAESLRVRDGFPREKSLLLWSSYMIAAERDTRECQRTFISYDQLMTDWRAARRRIEEGARLPFPRDTAASAIEIDRFLDQGLRHHKTQKDDLFSRPDVPDEVKLLYRLFSDACDGADIDPAAISPMEARLADADSLVGPLMADLRARSRGLANDVAELNAAHAGARSQADSLAERLAAETARREKELEAAVLTAEEQQGRALDLDARLSAAEASLDAALQNAGQHLDHVRSLQDALAAAAADKARLSGDVASAQAQSIERIEELRRLDARIVEIERERDQHATDAQGLRERTEQLAATIAESEAERERLRVETQQERVLAEQLGAKVAEIEAERERLATEAEGEQRRAKQFADTIADLEAERDRLTAEAQDERRRGEENRAAIADLQAERDRLATMTEDGRRRADELQADLVRHEADRIRLRCEVEAAETRANRSEAESKTLSQEVDRLQASSVAAKTELAETRQGLDAIQSEIDATISAVEVRVRRQVAEVEAQRDRLSAETAAERARAEQLEAQLQTSSEEATRARAAAMAAEAKLLKFELRLEEVEEEFEATIRMAEQSAQKQIVAAEGDRDQLAAEAETHRLRSDELRQEIENGRVHFEALTAEIAHLRGNLEALRGSAAWRVTKPFRRSVGWLRRRLN